MARMYEVPSSEVLRLWLKEKNLTQSMAAKIVDVEGRTVRKWTANDTAANHRSMPWSAWTLLRLYTGEMTIEEYRGMVESGLGSHKSRVE